jgi:hypothetical protein
MNKLNKYNKINGSHLIDPPAGFICKKELEINELPSLKGPSAKKKSSSTILVKSTLQ